MEYLIRFQVVLKLSLCDRFSRDKAKIIIYKKKFLAFFERIAISYFQIMNNNNAVIYIEHLSAEAEEKTDVYGFKKSLTSSG